MNKWINNKKANTTGEHSVYTVYEGHEVMFHVSTMLPYIKDSKQRENGRKGHKSTEIIINQICDL